MNSKKYSIAGWLSIIGAIVFPLAFFIGVVHDIIAKTRFHYHGPNFGPGDILFIAFTVIAAYVLSVFRDMLNERYNTRELDLLINLSIGWVILMQVCSLGLKGTLMALWPVSETIVTITSISIMAVFMVTIGIIDILIGVRLLRIVTGGSDLLRPFAYITLIAGILEASVFMSPLSIIMVPISNVILGMILLKEKEGAEFV